MEFKYGIFPIILQFQVNRFTNKIVSDQPCLQGEKWMNGARLWRRQLPSQSLIAVIASQKNFCQTIAAEIKMSRLLCCTVF